MLNDGTPFKQRRRICYRNAHDGEVKQFDEADRQASKRKFDELRTNGHNSRVELWDRHGGLMEAWEAWPRMRERTFQVGDVVHVRGKPTSQPERITHLDGRVARTNARKRIRTSSLVRNT